MIQWWFVFVLMSLLIGPVAADTPASDFESHQSGSTVPHLSSRPRRSLTAVASQRVDRLADRADWDLTHDLTLHKALNLPTWVSLSIEERVRYEDYRTPWIKDTSTGQYAVPIQSVIWGEVRPSETFRLGAEFWDARQYGSSDPNVLNNSMVNPGNFAQIYAAWIQRDLFGLGVDVESKAGQMTMNVGSTRLIGRYAFRNDQQSYVGIQERIRDPSDDWEFLAFANVPERLLPDTRSGLKNNDVIWNRPETNAYFTGAFLQKRLEDHQHLETFFYYLSEGTADPKSRVLYTPGFRLYREVRRSEFDYEWESVGPTGSMTPDTGGAPIAVGSLMEHIQLGYSFDAPWSPRVTAMWDFASSHFDSLFGINVFEFGPTGILGFFNRTNIDSPGYRVQITPSQDVFIFLSNRLWWLADPASSSGWSTAHLVDLSGRSGRYVGQTVELSARWDAAYNISFQSGWQVLIKGQFARDAPGAPSDTSNVNYFYVQTELRY